MRVRRGKPQDFARIILIACCRFDITVEEDARTLIHVVPFNPIFISPELLDLEVGSFSCTIACEAENNDVLKSLDALADPFELFPDCSVDQAKPSISGSCEDEIYYFCRNEFFPFFDISDAPQAAFDQICDCVNLLCAGLPSGENISEQYQQFTRILYSILATITFIGLLLFFVSAFQIIRFVLEFGMTTTTTFFLYHCCKFLGYHPRLVTWVFLGLYFVMSSIFFVTQVIIFGSIDVFQSLSEEADIDGLTFLSAVFSPTQIEDNYYQAALSDSLEVDDYYTRESDPIPFLIGNLSDAIPDDLKFQDFWQLITLNRVSFLICQAVAVISVFDIFLVWLRAIRKVRRNAKNQEQQGEMASYSVRIFESALLLLLSCLVTRFLVSNGKHYSPFFAATLCLVSILSVIIYTIVRFRLRAVLGKSLTTTAASGATKRKIESRTMKMDATTVAIRRTSTVVILANLAVLLTQALFATQVRNADEFTKTNNNGVVLASNMLQDVIMLLAQCAISQYLYRDYKLAVEDSPTIALRDEVDDVVEGQQLTVFRETTLQPIETSGHCSKEATKSM